MAAGMGLLGLAPDEFWRTTPRELAAALRGRLGEQASPSPLAPTDLERLMQRFPDQE